MVAQEYRRLDFEILISDDDEDCREAVREALAPRYRTVMASCGGEAIEIVRRHFVHVMIVDMNMPDMSGLETVTIVHRRLAALVPSILMSADNSRELRSRARAAQCESFVPKPIEIGPLRQIVEEIIRRHYGDG